MIDYTIEVGGIVTINGTIVKVDDDWVKVQTKNSGYIMIHKSDINTYAPKIIVSDVDLRRGN